MTAQQLPLEPTAMLPLREAYERTELRDRYTYEQAMSLPLVATCLRNQAEAIVKAQK